MAKVIYILGSGRSGTTLLDIILGNQKGISSCGELNRFAKRSGVPHSARDGEVEQLWTKVGAEIFYDLTKMKELSDKLEYHSGVLKSVFVSKSKKKEFDDYNQKLYNSIFQQFPNTITLIDSSKYPLRGLRLARKMESNIKFVYIQRNPIDVVESFQKKDIEQPSKSRLKANLYLLVVNSLAVYVMNKVRKHSLQTTISYDDLLKNPADTITKISNDLDIDLSNIYERLEQNNKFEVGKLFDGNRLRLENYITLQKRKRPIYPKKSSVNSIFVPLHKLLWYKFR